MDDGSTDDTEEKIKDIKDERVHYFCMSKNSGASRARNAGVEKTQYEIIAFHDSDDVWKPEKLEKQMECWEADPELVMVYCALTYTDPDTGEPVVFPFSDISRENLNGDLYEFLLHRNTIDTPTMLLKKQTFMQAGGFDPLYPPLEDWEFNLRVSRLGRIGFVDEPLLISTISEGSLSSSTSNYYNARCRIFAEHLEEIRTRGLFDEIAGDILRHAEHDGVLDSVKKMMMLHLMTAEQGGVQ
jgi:glycosyltransferase involved in cell wall biosynthesis